MKKLINLLLICSIFIFVTAFKFPSSPKSRVNDYAGMISDSVEKQLEEKLKDFEDKTTNQVVIATFPKMEGGSLESLSIQLAEKWKIGQKDKDNGVILIVFRDDHKLRIEVGYGLEGVLTDVFSKLIIERDIVPYFKNGQIDQGFLAGVNSIISVIDGNYTPKKLNNKGHAKKPSFVARLLYLLMLLLFIYMFFKRNLLIIGGWGNISSGSSSFGSGGFSGGGFSGGGGSFGGGGASGSW